MLDGLWTVLVRDLVTSARRPRTYQRRVLVVVGLLMGLTGGLPALFLTGSLEWELHPWQIRDAARGGFSGMLGCVGVLILGFIPAAVASGIAGERERGSLSLLLTTRLNAFEIIAGKLAAALLRFAAWLAAGLPLLVLLHRVGGFDLRLLLLAAAGTATTSFFVAAMVAAVSVGSRALKHALGISVLLAVAWLDFPFMAVIAGPRLFPGVYRWFNPVNLVLLESSPLSVVAHAFGLILRAGIIEVVLRMMAYELVGGLLLTSWAVFRLRPASRLLDGAGDAPKRVRARSGLRQRPPCGDEPMMWKERYVATSGLVGRLLGWAAYGSLFVILAMTVATVARPAWMELLSEGFGVSHPGDARWQFNQMFLRPLTGFLMFFVVLMVGAMTGESLEHERSRNTWTVLLSTPLSGREILRAKQAAMLRRWRPLFVALGLVWVAGLAVGSLHPLGLAAAVASLFASARAATALGAYSAVKAVDKAPGMSFGFLVFLSASLLAPLPCFLLGRAEPALLAGASPPFLTTVSLLTRDEVRAALGWGPFGGLEVLAVGGHDGGASWIVAAALLGPVALNLIATKVNRAAERAWDGAVGRPVRAAVRVGESPA
jgi:ABC-type Na+ efflux pump permease subunit